MIRIMGIKFHITIYFPRSCSIPASRIPAYILSNRLYLDKLLNTWLVSTGCSIRTAERKNALFSLATRDTAICRVQARSALWLAPTWRPAAEVATASWTAELAECGTGDSDFRQVRPSHSRSAFAKGDSRIFDHTKIGTVPLGF